MISQRAETLQPFAQQVIRFLQANGLGHLPCSLRTLQLATHKHPSPAIRARVGEDAEGFVAQWRVLPALKKAKPGIYAQIPGGRVDKRRGVELKLEDFPTRPAPGMQPSQAQWLVEPDPVCVDGNGRGHALNAHSSSATPRGRSSLQVPRSWRSRFS